MESHQSRTAIRVPALGLGDAAVRLSVWLVPSGTRVAAGDAVVELLTDGAVVDLPAPASGLLVDKAVAEDSEVSVGQVLAWVKAPGEQDD